MKNCSSCHTSKKYSEFGNDKRSKDGYNTYCKSCCRERSKKYRKDNPDKVKIARQTWKENNLNYSQEYYEENKDKIINKVKEYRDKNIELIREKDKARDEKDKPKRRVYLKERYHNDPLHKLKVNLRTRINQYVRKNGFGTIDLLGCSYDEVRQHIESKFTKYMTWDNHGKFGWHIDHIIPLASASTEEELFKLCHYTNLQPLWWNENLSKGDKILNV